MRVIYPGWIGIWRCWFLWREENWRTRRKSSEQGESQQQTQPTYGTVPESNPGHVGGRRALSPLRHPCSPNKHLNNKLRVILIKTGYISRGTAPLSVKSLRASAWETGSDLETKVGRFRSKLVHKVVMWTYVICQSFRFNDLLLAEFWISAPQGSTEADF